jgi:hypothetical protein
VSTFIYRTNHTVATAAALLSALQNFQTAFEIAVICAIFVVIGTVIALRLRRLRRSAPNEWQGLVVDNILLTPCPICDEWRSLELEILCSCHMISCYDCGLRYRRPISGYYDQKSGRIGHVPYFYEQAHQASSEHKRRAVVRKVTRTAVAVLLKRRSATRTRIAVTRRNSDEQPYIHVPAREKRRLMGAAVLLAFIAWAGQSWVFGIVVELICALLLYLAFSRIPLDRFLDLIWAEALASGKRLEDLCRFYGLPITPEISAQLADFDRQAAHEQSRRWRDNKGN